MSAIALTKTLSPAALSSTPASAGAATPAKGAFARIIDAVVAARTAQAEREVARYLALRDSGAAR